MGSLGDEPAAAKEAEAAAAKEGDAAAAKEGDAAAAKEGDAAAAKEGAADGAKDAKDGEPSKVPKKKCEWVPPALAAEEKKATTAALPAKEKAVAEAD